MNSILTFKGKGGIESFNNFIPTISTTYQSIYTSFGSKQNEVYVSSNSSSLPERVTNASYQMVPSFMRNITDDARGLVIVIDDFHDNDSLLQNENILTDLSTQFTWLDFIIVDAYLTKNVLYSILQSITNFANSTHILPNDFKISNFIRFRQPNSTEQALEIWIPDFIQRILDTLHDGKYNHSYYQWFGYSFYTYDYMYCYKTYKIAYMFYTTTIYDILHKSLITTRLNEYNIIDVQYYVNERDKRLLHVWGQFKANSITFVL
jgi:hypothetical protein